MSYVAIDCESREEWLSERKLRVGASDVAAILGVSKYKSAYSLWMEKHGNVQPEDLGDNEAVQWGILLEPMVRDEAARRLGVEISYDGEYRILASEDHPPLSCTLDGYIPEPSMHIREMFDGDITGPGVLEIKTAGRYTREAFDNGGVPEQYKIQVMAQMVVTGYRWGLVAYLLEGKSFGVAPVEWDSSMAGEIIRASKAFVRSIASADPPSPDYRDNDTIARMFPVDYGGAIELSSEFDEIDQSLQKFKGQAKDLAIEIKTLEAKIKDAIGDSTFGELNGGARYSYKQQSRKGHSVAPSSYRVLRRLKG